MQKEIDASLGKSEKMVKLFENVITFVTIYSIEIFSKD